jgi:hypothetical protein
VQGGVDADVIEPGAHDERSRIAAGVAGYGHPDHALPERKRPLDSFEEFEDESFPVALLTGSHGRERQEGEQGGEHAPPG